MGLFADGAKASRSGRDVAAYVNDHAGGGGFPREIEESAGDVLVEVPLATVVADLSRDALNDESGARVRQGVVSRAGLQGAVPAQDAGHLLIRVRKDASQRSRLGS